MGLLIVGAGAMGRWVAAAAGDAFGEVAFADVDREVAAVAAASRGRVVPLEGEERFEAVCFAVPISVARSAIAAQAPRAERAVFDVTGTMTEPIDAMSEHASDRERASFHPLFAPEHAPGTVAVAVDAPGPVTDRVREALSARGNDLFETTPEEHDVAMETVQARAHAAILAFALAAEDVPEALHTPVSAALADLAARVTDGTSGTYAEIQTAFDGAEDVAAAADRIADADSDGFVRLYREARTRIDRVTPVASDRTGRGGSDATGATTEADGTSGLPDEGGDPDDATGTDR